ncbi:MAG: hypothetical protein WAW08_02615 [Candidatus Microthrix parvicella]
MESDSGQFEPKQPGVIDMSLGLAATGVWASGLVVDGDYNDHLIDGSKTDGIWEAGRDDSPLNQFFVGILGRRRA